MTNFIDISKKSAYILFYWSWSLTYDILSIEALISINQSVSNDQGAFQNFIDRKIYATISIYQVHLINKVRGPKKCCVQKNPPSRHYISSPIQSFRWQADPVQSISAISLKSWANRRILNYYGILLLDEYACLISYRWRLIVPDIHHEASCLRLMVDSL